jgi:hypothetical protein
MNTSTLLCASLLCAAACVCAPQPGTPVIACNTSAITAAERPRYSDLTKRLIAAVRGRSEVREGYSFTLDGKAIRLQDVAEWISLEKLCCPFLTFELSVSGGQNDWQLQLTGPEGVKALLKEEFAKR